VAHSANNWNEKPRVRVFLKLEASSDEITSGPSDPRNDGLLGVF